MNEDIRQKLTIARALLDTPKKWTKGALARNAKCEPVSEQSEEAVCFCSAGAMGRVGIQSSSRLFRDLGLHVPGGVVDYNDRNCRTHEEILAMFDKGIAQCDLPETPQLCIDQYA